MRIGIVSDSHDHLTHLRRAVEMLEQRGAEVVLHGGDFVAPFAVKELLKAKMPVHAVFGNNDGERQGIRKLFPAVQDPPLVLQLGGRKIVLDHYPEVASRAEARGADVLIFGHTHHLVVQPGPPLMLNPGECCGWLTGRATCAMLDTETLKVELLDL
ncbi:MAG: metallophosphoesterase [Planctomycetes bacterium]|nr:metallophosphoesterase [Planctomycetota bacterium]